MIIQILSKVKKVYNRIKKNEKGNDLKSVERMEVEKNLKKIIWVEYDDSCGENNS